MSLLFWSLEKGGGSNVLSSKRNRDLLQQELFTKDVMIPKWTSWLHNVILFCIFADTLWYCWDRRYQLSLWTLCCPSCTRQTCHVFYSAVSKAQKEQIARWGLVTPLALYWIYSFLCYDLLETFSINLWKDCGSEKPSCISSAETAEVGRIYACMVWLLWLAFTVIETLSACSSVMFDSCFIPGTCYLTAAWKSVLFWVTYQIWIEIFYCA